MVNKPLIRPAISGGGTGYVRGGLVDQPLNRSWSPNGFPNLLSKLKPLYLRRADG